MADRVLVVDDDPDVRSVVEITLQLEGYEVETAENGRQALEQLRRDQPDIVVLDVMMPEMGGLEALRQLRDDARLSHIPVLLLTAKARTGDQVAGLEDGADDYVTKPFDAEELVARVRSVVRRSRQAGSVSPVTGLPGNIRIQQELDRRFVDGEPFAIIYADINDFKSVNDHYDWLRGDECIRLLAEVIKGAVADVGDERTFVGHIGGDDFAVVTRKELAEPLASRIAVAFDREVPKQIYDPEDLERRFVEVEDRQGNLQKFPPVTISIGIASNAARKFQDYRALVQSATEMKNYAKKARGQRSNYAIDRRTDG